ncbi:2-amino-4-hydroxy-6-hydroxymethyldihydropteridine diphosphokinase [Thiolapillus brandeum]|uniref:2-amino-4-hydroxy-6-hydroxymethyldihydropteridine pyrophosphokinase n=1 Tax=Thiolapillus brandeum TaxID=1076588 RepID=A0A7U6GIF5_9GAMM|nr:2-amino-4-hydroxy-6-hydroxymethyldihydropteridine diphosphokinase [Thiolapillus brandeum]BAO44188.1 2-amino-4-hydroxy-6-hydroxymethyldihydropteridine pyrophosphokinase [Thiolapillus brandeum]
MIAAYIGLGSNLDHPRQQVLRAMDELDALPQSRLGRVSSLYISPPMGPQDQPDYVNAAAQLHTELPPLELLDALQAIEKAHHRVRAERWGARTLDLDLLLYGDETMDSERLTIPHPGMAQRRFVLQPLAEIDAYLQVPGLGTVQALLEACPQQTVRRSDEQ